MAAILHADVAGFSRLMADDEGGTLSCLKRGLGVIGDNIARNYGRLCNTAGDAVLAEFPSVSAAVTCAVDTQRQIAQMNEGLPEGRQLSLRIGINLGEVMADDDGQVYGTGVNVAARLQALSEPGGITISGRAREQVDGSIPVGFASMGRHRVKNIPTPVHVLRVVAGTPTPAAARAGRWRKARLWILAAIIGLLVIGGLGFWLHGQPNFLPGARDATPSIGAEQTRLAVLPFRNTSGDAQQDYFAEAITQNLTGAFGRFSEIGVIASEAIVASDDSPSTLQELRRKFGVGYLLTGSVHRDGETIRLVAKLIDTGSGLQIWSQHYDRPIGKLFEVQDEIVRAVAGEAMVSLGRAEQERVFGKAIPDLEAYDLFVQGRALVDRETRDANIEARRLFRAAIDRDPDFALAYVGLASTYFREATRGWSEFMSRNITAAEDLARRALQLDPELAEAYEMLGWVSLLRGNYEQSEVELRKAVMLNPNSLGTLQALGNALTFLGDADGAVRCMEKAVSLGARPSSRSLPVLGLAYVLQDRPEQAIRFLETYARGRRDHFYYATLAIAYSELGDLRKAEAAADDTRRAWPFFDGDEFARQFRNAGQRERIISALRKAGLA